MTPTPVKRARPDHDPRDPRPFVCPRCKRTSWHPEDARQGYCGACHAYTGTPNP